ncbi:MAG: response regulator [Prolixibacteraceae bacterium]|nr:response regulator [Prolixibacteraceae bacterium]
MQKLFLSVLSVLIFCVALKAQNDRFYSSLEGLSGTTMHGFYQDSREYLWIPTDNGLNRFDGYNFKVYKHNPNDTTTLNSNAAYSVFEDSAGNLWVGTNYGLNLYSYKFDNFRQIRFYMKENQFSFIVNSIIEDSNKKLWLTTSHGLIRFDPKTESYNFFNHRFRNDGIPYHSKYNQSIIDEKGNLWIGTEDNSVLIFDVQKEAFLTISEYTGLNYDFPDRTVLTICQSKPTQILFGTQRAGIVCYDKTKQRFQQTGYLNDPHNLLDGAIYSILSDRGGKIWVGTEHNGLKQYHPETNTVSDVNELVKLSNVDKAKFFCYEDRSGDLWFGIQFRGIYHKISSVKMFHSIGNSSKASFELSHFIVKSILTDRNGNIWVGTDGGGLNVKWKGRNEFVVFKPANKGTTLNDKAIICLYEDSRGWIWIGTYLEGLYCYRGEGKEFTNYKMPGSEKENWNNYIFDVIEDARGNLWIGTNGGGLFYLNVGDGTIKDSTYPLVAGKNQTIKPFINTLHFDVDSTLWIGTYNGMFCWNQKKDTFRSYLMESGDIASDIAFSVVSDSKHRVWFGTLDGLYCYDQERNKLERYTTEDGLCNNAIMSIEIDHRDNLWISTSDGISKMNSETRNFQNYYVYDGLPCNEFRPGASFKDNNGNLYFGGIDGMVYFHPDNIVDNPIKPNLIFTSLKIFNQEIKFSPGIPNKILKCDINSADTIVLDYTQKSFSIEFAAINFSVPEKIKYSVQLDGFSSGWDYKDYKQRYASYTNLNSGKYTLNVRYTNPEGQWIDEPRKLIIIIKPPFWLTWWAYVIYAGILAVSVYYIRKIALYRIKLKNQLHLEHVEREKLEEINQSKMQFFTNISHEIRTPLTMLTAPIERLIESNPNETQKKYINYIYRNTKRLERIVTQLLELQKIENTQFVLKAREIELVKFIKEIVALFDETAIDKKILVSFEPKCDELMVWIDPDKMDKILFNLLSNAFKFSQPGGLITVSISKNIESGDEGTFTVSVSDTGRGMEQIHLDRIFDRFYQIENKETGQITGTGIGLHLSKELVEKHHGCLTVKSQAGKGSTFTIQMPLGKKHLVPQEIFNGQDQLSIWKHGEKPDVSLASAAADEHQFDEITETDKTLVLLIEDDLDILNYLEDELSGYYQIIKANNGNDGWKLAFERTPDLIVSDIMMPGLDGLQLCRKVKSTIETSHIPVILLTAKTSIEQEIEGLETGADEYIHKPFHPRLLKLKVDKVIEAREALKQQFTKNASFTVKEITVTSADEKFLQKAIDFAKENLSDTDLNIEKMSTALCISRVHLYRKLKAITNQNPTEFIRTIRLKQAAYLLSQGKLNISEVAYMVGFNSHQYFTNSFQKFYGMSPTEYCKKNGKEG